MDGMDGMDRMTKMTNAAAALLSGEPDMNGGTAARDATGPESRSPLALQATCASDRAGAQGILVILLILSILSSCRSRPGRDARSLSSCRYETGRDADSRRRELGARTRILTPG